MRSPSVSAHDSKTLIGLTLDLQKAGQYSNFPWYGLRQNYASSLSGFGAIPLALPYITDVSAYLNVIHGLLITGGDFDIDPAFYGESNIHPKTSKNAVRSHFEMELLREALKIDMPVLGICGGQQLLHVALGGTLVQHIPDFYRSDIQHEQPNPRDEVSHPVHIVTGTLLHKILQTEEFMVNSAHHQSAREPERKFHVIVNARSPDGVIEGIESTKHTFCLGVQWHPEFLITDQDRLILKAFVTAAQNFAKISKQSGILR